MRSRSFPLRPDPRLLEAANRLGGLADFLVITANGPPLLQAEIEQLVGRKVLSMVKATLDGGASAAVEARRRSGSR